ncbi:DUF5682 family protein [Microbacterium sp. EST19A]|uniref:DUF5682 family protein n=1 Tax=Microbacterium sp. EST19A TaxID=2862681 RepID=UPI001CBE4485|nr:DUF5682 family protein [Microbacterium sp. EST19A]
MTQIHVLGVRHHGPGSARAVSEALDALDPDAVLVEGAPELDPILPFLIDADMRPPVAGIVYPRDDPRGAVFYPLAMFSPEWVASRWALERGRVLAGMDLPAVHALAIRRSARDAAVVAEQDAEQDADAEIGSDPSDEPDGELSAEAAAVLDPVTALAHAAGYDDPERWWEDAVEQRSDSPLTRFAALTEAIAELRSDTVMPSTLLDENDELDLSLLHAPLGPAMTAVREAAMRKRLRAEVKAGHERIVVVCGAWHAPALDLKDAPTAASDTRLLRGLPKIAVDTAWVPWTAARLSQASGYGAGVASPGWYAHLFRLWAAGSTDDPGMAWLVRVARELRAQGVPASPASVVDAFRLAETLAAVRGRPAAGLDELNDAVLSALLDGNPLPLDLVRSRLIVGDDIGAVPEGAPRVPLAADLERQQRTLRLKPTATAQQATFDLRTESGLAKSVLLHRLRLLGVPWGRPVDAGSTTGTFKEAWELRWEPELSVALISASTYGGTVVDAATSMVAEIAASAASLGQLSTLIGDCLDAQLPVVEVVRALSDRAAEHSDVSELLSTVEPLATVCRYGTLRTAGDESGIAEVRRVLDTTVVRVCIGLPAAAVMLDDAAAARLRAVLDSAHLGVLLLDDAELRDRWCATLRLLAERDRVSPLIAGRAARLLHDVRHVDDDWLRQRMRLALSAGADPRDAAGWLEGAFAGDAALIIHDRQVLGLIDTWLTAVDEQVFDDLLPLLRRTFSEFHKSERATIGRLVATPEESAGVAVEVDVEAAGPALAAVARLLGWHVTETEIAHEEVMS